MESFVSEDIGDKFKVLKLNKEKKTIIIERYITKNKNVSYLLSISLRIIFE